MIIRNGLIALPGYDELQPGALRVREGRIAEIVLDAADRGSAALLPDAAEEVLDAGALIILPGAIDPHVHFDEPGFTHREDFFHGSSEAAKGGVTTVIDMPCTSLPPVTTAAALDNKLAAIAGKAVVDYALFGGVSGHRVETSLGAPGRGGAMAELAGRVVGYKCYFISGMETFTRVSHDDFARIIAEGRRLGRPILLHAEDLDYVNAATARLAALRGSAQPTWADYVESRPEAAELVACASALALARGSEASLHVVHVGTSAAARLLHAGGASCETCAHYLAFSSDDFAQLGVALKTAPVVKGPREREELWSLLAEGAIDFVASDHAPAPASEKNTGNVLTAYGGIPGTGTWLPYLVSEGLLGGRLGLRRFLEATSGAAARRYGLSARKGSIAVGKDADLVLVDPSATTTISGTKLFSKGRITPFEGMKLNGRIVATYLRGRKIYDADIFDAQVLALESDEGFPDPSCSGILAEPGYGKFLSWGYR